MKTQHTPGPWFLAQHKQNPANLVKVESLNRVICDAFGRSEEDRANARLIAAAPDLLQVAKDYVLLCQLHDQRGAVLDAARAAIDRAEPRSS